jgi:hypothetical protein
MNDVKTIRDVAPDGSLLNLPPFDDEVHFERSKVAWHVIKIAIRERRVFGQLDDQDIKFSFNLISVTYLI